MTTLVGSLVLAAAGAGCGGEEDQSPEYEKIDRVLTAFGFDPATAVITEDRITVDDDIFLLRADIDGYIEALGTRTKGYICNSTFPPGRDGKVCAISLDSFVNGQAIIGMNSIRLVIDPNVPADWRASFRRAAHIWSTSHHNNLGTRIAVDAEGKRSSLQWTITVRVNPAVANASASWPAVSPSGFFAPGTLIEINPEWSFFKFGTQTHRDSVAVHEMGHTFGLAHPTQGTHIPGTASGGPVSCVEGQETLMCAGEHFGKRFLYPDDILSAQTLFPAGITFNLQSWNTSFCSVGAPCEVGQGDCDSNAECAGYLICLSSSISQSRYGAPSGNNVCGPASTEQNDGVVTCSTSATTTRCDNAACPCGVGQGDCDNDQECGGGLRCGTDNGPATGQNVGWDMCKHAQIPGCGTYSASNPQGELCTPSCPCSLGEGDCDTDDDCIGDLVCAQNSGAAFITRPDYDICVRPEQDAVISNIPADPTCANGIQNGNVCCHAECGTCGGSGCSGRTSGGGTACCTGTITTNAVSCSEYAAPCLMN